MFAIIPIIGIEIFAFVFAMIFSPKLRAKMMDVHIKATKYMDALKIYNIEETMFCKHCGTPIDIDSKFCKKCGKEQQLVN